ncbi:MAG: hypothetical protein ACP5QR_17780 [Rhizomicrobium sp.]|jgi:hypothetical protein
MDDGLTEHQRHCLEHLRRAEALGLSLTEYARAHGVKVRMLYDAVVHFRRRGMMAKTVKVSGPRKPREERQSTELAGPFVAVRVEPEQTRTDRLLPFLRLQHVGGHVLEFGAWPPADVLAVILAGGHDVTA